MRNWLPDLRIAWRGLLHQPGFAAVAVASLALGIGANTAIFSLVDRLLLWSIPARDPASLVHVQGGRSMTYPFFMQYRDRNQVFAGMIASSNATLSGVRPEGAGAVETARVVYVSGNFFEVLGVGAAAGRAMQPDDERAPVAVLSHAYWQRRYGGEAKAIGQKIAIHGYPVEIAGVAERGFSGIFNTQQPPDLFLPVTAYPETTPAARPVWNTPNMHWLNVMARLKPGVGREQAQAAMRVLFPQVAEIVNGELVKAGRKARDYSGEKPITLDPGRGGISTSGTTPLAALSVATGLVLLIACANVANLLLARATGRSREIAVRTALGASRGRLVRQLLTESVVLASIGGVLGVLLASWAIAALGRTDLVEQGLTFEPNLRVLGFSVAVTLLTSLLFGLVPALRATGVSLNEAIKDGGAASQSRGRLRLGKAVIAAQVALTLPLLVGAGLFLRTLVNLHRADVGFSREDVLIVDIDPTKSGYREHRLRVFYDQLLDRVRQVPGVRSASLSLMTPMGEYAMSRSFSVEGYQPKEGERVIAYSNAVSPGYFQTLGIPILLGRDFRPQDEPAVTPKDNLMTAIGRASGGSDEAAANATRVCILNESMARRFFGSESAVGRHVSFEDRYSAETALEIVGVVKDVRHGSAREQDREGIIYTPSWANGAEARFLEIRSSGNPAGVLDGVRGALRELDANVPLLKSRRLEEYVAATYRDERLIAYLCAAFGFLALILAAVGLYGVMAYAVAQRTRELGIRMAVGARAGHVIGMLLRELLIPVLLGTVVGLAASLALTRLASALLYGVAPFDPVSVGVSVAMLLVASLGAVLVPALRASRIDPIEILRYQ